MKIQHLFRSAQLKPWITLTILAVVCATAPRPAHTATIYMKDKRSVEGTVDEAASDEAQIVIRTSGVVLKIPRVKIERIDVGTSATQNAKSAGGPEQALLNKFERELAQDPGNPELRRKVEELRRSIQSRASLNYDALFQKIDTLIENQKFEEAVREADQTIARISDEGAKTLCKSLKARAHIGLARQCHNNVNYPEEERNYRQAIEADPENPIAPLELADMLQVSPARKTDAIALYERGIETAIKHAGLIDANILLDYETKLADLYLSDKRFAEAGDRFFHVLTTDKAMRHNRADDAAIDAYSRIPVATMEAALRDHVIANTKAILAGKPHKQAAYLLLGRIYLEQKDWANARDNLKLAVENVEPGAAGLILQEALFSLGSCQRKLHENQAALATFSKLVALKPDHYDALCEAADILMEESNLVESRRFYEQALTLDADKYRAHLGKGTTLQREGKFEEARKSFKDVLERDKENAIAQLAIARAYFEEKKYEDTITEADKAIQIIRDRYSEEKSEEEETATGAAPTPAPTPEPTPMSAAALTTTTTAAAPTTATMAAGAGTSATLSGFVPVAAPTPTPSPKEAEDAALLAKISDEDRPLMAEANTLIGKANVLSQPPKTNLARDNFGTALKFDANFAPAYEGLGMSYAADKLDPQAEENFLKASAIEPRNPNFYLSFGLYWQQDRKIPERALPLYLKYQELGGRDPEVNARIKECGGTPKTS